MKLSKVTALIITFLAGAATAQAQSVSPMSQDVQSFGGQFMVQIKIQNTYATAQKSEIRLYDDEWNPVQPKYLSMSSAVLTAGDVVTVTALIPFDDRPNRVIYICNSILPRLNGLGASYRGEVCGKVKAQRLQPSP